MPSIATTTRTDPASTIPTTVTPDEAATDKAVTDGTTIGTAWLTRAAAHRKWPIVLGVVSVALCMCYLFFWGPVVQHRPVWQTGGDLWGVLRAAHYVGWGYTGGIYAPGNGFLAFPGFPVLLAPVAMLIGHLHLTESVAPMFLAHPTAAILLDPVEAVLAATVMFATDALAERLGTSQGRRIALCVMVGAVAWPVAAVWGHAEDALALTLALYALLAAIDGRWSRCGWLLGVGIAVQPLVGLMVPVLLGATPRGRRVLAAVRAGLPAAALVAVALAGNWKDTISALVKQPTPPSINHATPWVAWAPKLPVTAPAVSQQVHVYRASSGREVVHAITTVVHGVPTVAGGPGRIIELALAVALGLWTWRRPGGADRLVWLVAVALAVRCYFDAVMTPYYLAPPLIVGLLLAARTSRMRFATAAVAAVLATIYAYHHTTPWAWWVPVAALLTVVLVCGYPGRRRDPDGGSDSAVVTKDADRTRMPASERVHVRVLQGADGVLAARQPLT